MKTRTRTEVQYESCSECPFYETPDENGEIPIPNGGILRLNPTILNNEGKEIPNPTIGRCGHRGLLIRYPTGCGTWFDKK